MQFQVESYAGKVKALSIVWFIYAGFSLVLGIAGLAFAKAFLSGFLSPWLHNGPAPGAPMPEWFFPAILHFALIYLVIRSGLALVAAWGLWQRTEWGASSPSLPQSSACSNFPSAPRWPSGPW